MTARSSQARRGRAGRPRRRRRTRNPGVGRRRRAVVGRRDVAAAMAALSSSWAVRPYVSDHGTPGGAAPGDHPSLTRVPTARGARVGDGSQLPAPVRRSAATRCPYDAGAHSMTQGRPRPYRGRPYVVCACVVRAGPQAELRAAQHRARALGGRGHRRVARRRRLLDRQRAVGGAEAQRVRQRLLALADLLAGETSNSRSDSSSSPAPVAQRRLHLGRRHVARPRPAPRPGWPAGRWRSAAPDGAPAAPLEHGPGRAPSRRCARAARAPDAPAGAARRRDPTHRSPSTTRQRGAPARVPRARTGRRRTVELDARPRAATVARRLDGVRPARPGGPCPTSRPARARRRGRRRRAAAGPGSAASSAASSSSVGRWSTRQRGAAPRLRRRRQEHQAGLEQRQVGAAAADVAAQRGEQPRQQRGAQQRLLVGERVGQPHGAAPAGRPPARPSASRTASPTNG